MTVLLVGDDWAADHHDAGLMDQAVVQAIAKLAADGQCLLAAAKCFLRSPQLVVGEAEAIRHIHLPGPVAELAADGECLVAVSDGFFRASHPVDVAEEAQHPCFPGLVTNLPRGGQAELVRGDPIVPSFADVEVTRQSGRNLPCSDVVTGLSGHADRRHQVGMFSFASVEGLPDRGERQRYAALRRSVQAD